MSSVGGSFEVQTVRVAWEGVPDEVTFTRDEAFDLWRVLSGVLASEWVVTRDVYPVMWTGMNPVFVTTHDAKPGQPMAWCSTPGGLAVDLLP